MRAIRDRDTQPEKRVRSTLHRLGYRFRLCVESLPGTPDIVLPRYRVAIFVHGCFWHRHPQCRYAQTPKSNSEYWLTKFERNRTRDRRNQNDLREIYWQPIVVWECETRDAQALSGRLIALLSRTSDD